MGGQEGGQLRGAASLGEGDKTSYPPKTLITLSSTTVFLITPCQPELPHQWVMDNNSSLPDDSSAQLSSSLSSESSVASDPFRTSFTWFGFSGFITSIFMNAFGRRSLPSIPTRVSVRMNSCLKSFTTECVHFIFFCQQVHLSMKVSRIQVSAFENILEQKEEFV